jgi:hypothetical protein
VAPSASICTQTGRGITDKQAPCDAEFLTLRNIENPFTKYGSIGPDIPVADVQSDSAIQRVIPGTTIKHIVAVFSKQLVIAGAPNVLTNDPGFD